MEERAPDEIGASRGVASAQTENLVPVAECIGQPATMVGTPGAGVIRDTPDRDVIPGTDDGELILGCAGADVNDKDGVADVDQIRRCE